MLILHLWNDPTFKQELADIESKEHEKNQKIES